MNDESLIHVVYATDDGYLLPVKVSVASLICCAHELGKLRVHILDVGISDDNWKQFVLDLSKWFRSDMANMIVRHKVEVERFSNLRLWRGSCGTYARLLMPELLPNVAWCLYVDGDTLFTDDVAAISGLYDSSYAIQGNCEGDDDQSLKLYFQERNIPWHCKQYVCAGFLIMNLGYWRRNAITQKCLSYLERNSDAKYPDQDAMYVACLGKIGCLPIEWGTLNNHAFYGGEGGGVTLPKCIHYAFGKPWASRGRYYCLNDLDLLWLRFCIQELRLNRRDIALTKSQYAYHRGLSYVRLLIIKVSRLLHVCTSVQYAERFYAPADWMDIVKSRLTIQK